MSSSISFIQSAVSGESSKTSTSLFDERAVLHDLKHYLPAQAPLKDFIHHNTLHAFQDRKFHEAIRHASAKFGYMISLSLNEYRDAYSSGRITPHILEQVVLNRKGQHLQEQWIDKMLHGKYRIDMLPRIGALRSGWKRNYQLDMDSLVHPTLFRVVCSYLDQGISIWNFPIENKGFLESLKELERKSFSSFFKSKSVANLLKNGPLEIDQLLKMIVGKEEYFKQYLFDQQFAHQGWSGMVVAVESQPETLLANKNITIRDLIIFELLLELDALYHRLGDSWKPLSDVFSEKPVELFAPVPATQYSEVVSLWQEAFEWSYYDEVLGGIVAQKNRKTKNSKKSFQALFCIDDRECSFRRYLENIDKSCETFGTPGFFGVEFYFQPLEGKHFTKLCPAPMQPRYLIKEEGVAAKRKRDPHFSKHAHSFHGGWLITQTLGFWSAFRLFLNIFKPSSGPATASSFRHMDKTAKLTIEASKPILIEKDLQVGFTAVEMADRVEGLFKSIGLVKNFAEIVYVIGHGASSVNNPHYAAYDCGACSGRAGSVNARVICYMANHSEVRSLLHERGIVIPETTQFVGGLHDTTRDDIDFFDANTLSEVNQKSHKANLNAFASALDFNAKERSRRFEHVNTKRDIFQVHDAMRKRSVSLFEPRPELNHATNALCIVGRRNLSDHLFMDRRAFLNSYDYEIDPDGKYLFGILRAAAPVCGGINLEYYFSRVDNQKLGAGSKLPHNVMGLFGVANGIDGDLRPGLPSQMIEVHEPVRLLIIVEHFSDVVLKTIQRSPETYEWFKNEWVNLVIVNPLTHELSVFRDEHFVSYVPTSAVHYSDSIDRLIETQMENLPVYSIN
jgi:uncharacterized protein YbcC (UPF0753/DUF2309 family)